MQTCSMRIQRKTIVKALYTDGEKPYGATTMKLFGPSLMVGEVLQNRKAGVSKRGRQPRVTP
jgi:hypothetical protein